MEQPEQQERYGEQRGEQPERYSRDKKKWSHHSFHALDALEPVETPPFSAIPYADNPPAQHSASLVNAAYPAERLATLRFGAITAMPARRPDSPPAPIPTTKRLGVLQRFSGTGLTPLNVAQRQEQRARLITLILVAMALVLVIVSAFLLFNPTVRAPGFGLAPGQRDITKLSTAAVTLYATPTAVPGISSTPPPQGGSKSAPTPTAKPRPTARPVPTSTPTQPPVGPTPTPTAIPTPTPKPMPTATPRPQPTATPVPAWHSVLTQSAPDCNNPPGANWFTADAGATHTACQGGQLMLQQYVTDNGHFAELDVSDNQFSFTRFREQVRIHFTTPSDVNTWAILSAQTPKSPTQYSGMNFELNGNGSWQLDQVTGYSTVVVVGQGHFSINPAGNTTLMLIAQNNSLTAYINNSPVYGVNDTLNPNPGACGLLVRDARYVTSSQVLFANFEYDGWH